MKRVERTDGPVNKKKAIDFSKPFQKHILAMVLRVPNFLEEVRDCLRAEHFDDPSVNDVMAWTLSAWDETREVPSKASLIDTFGDIEPFIRTLYREDLTDEKMVMARVRQFAHNRAMCLAIMTAADMLNAEKMGKPYVDAKGKKVDADPLKLVADASLVGKTHVASGDDLFADFSALVRMASRDYDGDVLSTGFSHLDEAGLVGCAGEVGAILGIPGCGKSAMLTAMSLLMVRLGMRVLYYSIEMPRKRMAKRICSRIAGPKADISGDAEEFVNLTTRRLKQYVRGDGQYIIRYGTMFKTTIADIRAEIIRLRGQGIFPSVLFIDYPGVLKPEGKNLEKRFQLEEIWLAFRGLCQEFRLWGWGPAAATRDALKKMTESKTPQVLTMADIGECFQIMYHVDQAFAICQDTEEVEANRGRFYVLKNRYGKPGTVIDYDCDLSRGLFATTGLSRVPVARRKVSANKAEDVAFQDAVDKKRAEDKKRDGRG